VKDHTKTKGLIYKDFCCADNLLVLIHGKVISIFDLMDKRSQKARHIRLDANRKPYADGFYNFEHEPVAIWMMDKNSKITSQRWKLIVAFKNGEVKELCRDTTNKSDFVLKDYLINDRKSVKIPGKIVKIFRSKNDTNVPVYMVVKRDSDSKNVLATIEF
jgi:hypothetical protein